MAKLVMSKSCLTIGSSLLLCGIGAQCIAQDSSLSANDELSTPGVKTLDTGVLQNVSGYRGDVLGAEVVSISAGEDDLTQIIELSVPIDPDLADRALVVSPSGKRIELEDPIKISRDDKNNKVGITLKLSKKNQLEFKIKLIDLPDE
jgi:hypothetical protein